VRETSRSSERSHWDRFWRSARSVEDVYSNDGRVTEELTKVIDPSGKLVLEVGAGTGRDGILLSRMGADVVSLDYSEESLGLVRESLEGNEGVYLCCADAFSLPFADDTFDVVFHQGLLEHFRNPGDLIAENVRVLKPGGILLVDVPQRYHYYTVIKHVMIALNKWFAGWECEFSARELEGLLRRYGLEIVKTYGEWLNPPIWYRMLRRAALSLGIRLPMYPGFFSFIRRTFKPLRDFLLARRAVLYTTVIIGTIAVKAKKQGESGLESR